MSLTLERAYSGQRLNLVHLPNLTPQGRPCISLGQTDDMICSSSALFGDSAMCKFSTAAFISLTTPLVALSASAVRVRVSCVILDRVDRAGDGFASKILELPSKAMLAILFWRNFGPAIPLFEFPRFANNPFVILMTLRFRKHQVPRLDELVPIDAVMSRWNRLRLRKVDPCNASIRDCMAIAFLRL